jgi:hypothetical protein
MVEPDLRGVARDLTIKELQARFDFGFVAFWAVATEKESGSRGLMPS